MDVDLRLTEKKLMRESLSVKQKCNGIMGVPITFLDKYNPGQFKIIALGTSKEHYTPIKQYEGLKTYKPNGKIINGAPINSTLAIKINSIPLKGEWYSDTDGNLYVQPYARILIQRTKGENNHEV